MCGRYGLYRDPSPFARAIRARVPPGYAFAPRYNVAPTDPVLGVTSRPDREIVSLRWGLVPRYGSSAKPVRRLSTINARIETVATSPLYGPLLGRGRCIVFADGYYEWPRDENGATAPVWIERADRAPFAFAGLYSGINHPDGSRTRSCAIVTQVPNETIARVHDRMPVVLDAPEADAWLVPGELEPAAALALLPPSDPAVWTYRRVSRAVGNVRNDGPALIAPLEGSETQPSLFE